MQIVKILPLFILSAVLESATHLLLKKGANRHAAGAGVAYYLNLLRDRDVLAGIGIFVLESFIWVVILMFLPLSIAFPLTGLQKILLVSFTALVLREPTHPREWLAMGFIAAGLTLIALAGLG